MWPYDQSVPPTGGYQGPVPPVGGYEDAQPFWATPLGKALSSAGTAMKLGPTPPQSYDPGVDDYARAAAQSPSPAGMPPQGQPPTDPATAARLAAIIQNGAGSGPPMGGPTDPTGAPSTQRATYGAPPTAEALAARPTDYPSRIAAAEGGGPDGNTANKYSFIPSTWASFVNSPANTGGWTAADIGNPQAQEAAFKWNWDSNKTHLTNSLGRPATDDETASAHLLGPAATAAMLKDPTGDAFKTYASVSSPEQAAQAFSTNGKLMQQGMTNSQVLANVGQFYGGPDGTASTDGTGTTAATVALDNSRGAPSPGGMSNADLMKLITGTSDEAKSAFANMPHAMSQQNVMLALASGLLGGPTFGAGLGKGLNSVLGLSQQEQQNTIERAKAMASLGNAQATKLIGLGQLGLGQGRLASLVDHRGVTEGQGAQRLGIGQQNADAHTAGVNGAIDGTTATAKASGAANVTDQRAFNDQAQHARDSEQQIADLKSTLNTQDTTSPTVQAKLRNWISTTLGVNIDGVTPSGIMLNGKLITAEQTSDLLKQTGGKVPRALGEFTAIQRGLMSPNMTKDSIMTLLGNTSASNNRILGANKAWTDMTPADRTSAISKNGGLFSNWRNSFNANEATTRGTGTDGGTRSQIAPGPNGTFQHVDPTVGPQTTKSGVNYTISP
jgi:hypothetical protein